MKTSRRRRVFWSAFTLALACLVPRVGPAADKIRVAYSALAPTQGVLWVAEIAGLFPKNDLQADLVYTRAAIETLVSGEVQFGQMTGALMFSARLQGADPVMMAGAMKRAVEAGRMAFLAGRIPRKRYASASSPVDGLIAAGGRRA